LPADATLFPCKRTIGLRAWFDANAMDMANSALQAVLREAGGVRANQSLQQAQLLAAGKRFR